ncbi:hypothetical protein [Aurantimicrobium minutum]|uniref:hypothetical protein n=1 Tax=Aurantimicrobium minutum TaxID=708131 RepID=UPI00248DEC4D|nr:hypothetical protein [Aurantimicrobium minutum]
MTNALIISTGYDPEYLRIVEQISRECVKDGQTPIVLDLATIMTSPTETYSPRFLNLFGYKSCAQIFVPRLSERGVNVISAKEIKTPPKELPTDVEAILQESTQSALLTFFRTDILNFSKPRIARTRKRLLAEGTSSFLCMSEFLQSMKFEVAYVPNGRFPVQRMAKLALLRAGVPVFHFEKGATKDHAFFRPYSPHDRIATQGDVEYVLEGLPNAEVERIADAWLQARLPSKSSSNEYSAIWSEKDSSSDKVKPSQKRIGFFTSSQDEFLHLGPDWQLHSWTSQFEAFDTLITYFESQGFTCFMRVHPNLSTKEHACYIRELNGLKELSGKHPNLEVYWHDDATSSYSLLKECAGIVVWDSTIGLEASAQGIPVWNCAASYYGLIADTRQVLGPEHMDDDNLQLWNVDSHKAKRFIACTVLRDLPLQTLANDWATWDVSAPPFVVRASSFVRSGGAPTLTDSVLASVDPWRHRSWKVNRKLLKAKLSRLRSNKKS